MGCGHRTQPEVTADAKAGAAAYLAETDPAKRVTIANGLAKSVAAATANLPGLPVPAMSPEQIRADPEAYASAAENAAKDPPPYVPPKRPGAPPTPPGRLRELGDAVLWWGGLAAAIGAALMLVGLASRFLPLGWIGNLVASPILAPVARLLASLGSAGVIIGAAMSWLADWLWLVVFLVAIGVAIYHRRGLLRLWQRLRHPKA